MSFSKNTKSHTPVHPSCIGDQFKSDFDTWNTYKSGKFKKSRTFSRIQDDRSPNLFMREFFERSESVPHYKIKNKGQ